MTAHIEELAELYAVGSLDDAERERVRSHVADCTQCAARVQEAENAVAEIAMGQPMYEPSHVLGQRLRESIASAGRARHWVTIGLAVAAALAIAFIPTWLAVDRSRVATQAMRQDERALARIAAAPAFNRAPFMSPQKRPMDAKVLYGSKGDWYYVVVMHPKPGLQVAYVHNHRMEMLGTVQMHGESGSLYLPVNHRMDELALVQDDTVIAAAHLAY